MSDRHLFRGENVRGRWSGGEYPGFALANLQCFVAARYQLNVSSLHATLATSQTSVRPRHRTLCDFIVKDSKSSASADMPPERLYERILQRTPRNVSPTFSVLNEQDPPELSGSYLVPHGKLGYNLVKVTC